MKFKIKIFSLVITTIFFVGIVSACNSKTNWSKEEVYTYSFAQHQKGTMPIGCWVSPPPAMMGGNISYPSRITDEDYKVLAESGINMAIPLYEDFAKEEYRADIIKSLDLCEKYGLVYIMQDSLAAGAKPYGATKLNGFAGLDENSTAEEIKQIEDNFLQNYNQYKDKKALGGIRFLDEPGIVNNAGLKLGNQFLTKQNANQVMYSNLFPNHASKEQFYYGSYNDNPTLICPDIDMNYKKYLDSFCKTVNPKFLSFDIYPFLDMVGTNKGIMDFYFECLADVASVANDNKIPFWSFIQAFGKTPHTPTSRNPDETDLRWQVNTSLVCGAKGISYFTYYQLPNWDVPEDSMGMINRDGQKTSYYGYVQNMNKHIKAIEQTLMNSTLVGHIATNKDNSPALFIDSSVIADGKFREVKLIESKGSIITGCFDKNGKTVLYVLNNSIISGEEAVTINFNKNTKFKFVQNAQNFNKKGKAITLNIKSGDAVLVEIL